MTRSVWRAFLGLAVLGAVVAVTPEPAAASGRGWTERVSVSDTGAPASWGGPAAAVTRNGRFALFASPAPDLVPGDTNQSTDVFLRDRWTGRTERINVSSAGEQADHHSSATGLSEDGRYAAFSSYASNLVPGDTNGVFDGFVRDRWTGTTQRVSVSPGGAQGNDRSFVSAISANGRYLAIQSDASNLVPGDTNGWEDVFVRDRSTGAMSRVNVSSTGQPANDRSSGASITDDGRYAAFMSDASNLVPGDTNGVSDVFVHDRRTRRTERVSVSTAGVPGSYHSLGGSISANGRYVTFLSEASNLVPGDTNGTLDAFVRDRRAGTTTRASVSSTGAQGNGRTIGPTDISVDGRYVSFVSEASTLVPGDTNAWEDVFVHDRRTGTTERVSVTGTGAEFNGPSQTASLSRTGRYVLFEAAYSDPDSPGAPPQGGVFLRYRGP